MGTLTPGAAYIYERVDNHIYARKIGDSQRVLVGYDSKIEEYRELRYYMNHINDVLRMCETDPAMRELLDQLFVLYNLKKNNE